MNRCIHRPTDSKAVFYLNYPIIDWNEYEGLGKGRGKEGRQADRRRNDK